MVESMCSTSHSENLSIEGKYSCCFYALFENYLVLGLKEGTIITLGLILFHSSKFWHHFKIVWISRKWLVSIRQPCSRLASKNRPSLARHAIFVFQKVVTGPKIVYVGDQFQTLGFFQSGIARLYRLALLSFHFLFFTQIEHLFMQPTICKPMLCNTSDTTFLL